MKKIISGILALILVFSLSACGNKAENTEPETEPKVQTDVSGTKEEKAEDSFANWKEFLSEYEIWVDEYITVLKQYKENPTDTKLMEAQQNKLSELTDWANRTGEVQKELENAPEDVLKEYQAEVTRILEKITEAMK